MGRRAAGAGAGALLVAVMGLSGCGIGTLRSPIVPRSVPHMIPITEPPSTTTTSTVPVTPLSVVCGGGTEMDEPASTALDGLLMPVSDVPDGYISSGPDGATSSLLFGGELARSDPVAAISYAQFAQVASGLANREIDESVALDTSSEAASALAGDLESESAGCSPDRAEVHLPGTVPDLVAVTLVQGDVPDTAAGSQSEDVSSAEVYTAKGPYLVEISWENTLEIYLPGVAAPQPALPTATEMGSVADAALAHIPG